jgi:hypothetical protein
MLPKSKGCINIIVIVNRLSKDLKFIGLLNLEIVIVTLAFI